MSGLPIGPAAREPCTRAAGQASPPARLPSSQAPRAGGDPDRAAAGQAPAAAPPGSPVFGPGEPGTLPAGDGTAAGGASPAGATGLSGGQFRRARKTARAARNYGRRKQAARYVPGAAQGAGGQYRPGMGRRMPPDGGEARAPPAAGEHGRPSAD